MNNALLLKGATVYTMLDGSEPFTGDVLIENGKIARCAKDIHRDGAAVEDVRGLHLMPGLIDAHCHIGLFGTAMGERGVDGNEVSENCTPELRALDAVNPFDEEFEYSFRHGVTTVSTGPGSANPVCGQFMTMKTFGDCFENRVMRCPSAMKMAFGENPKVSHAGGAPLTRMSTAAVIRSALIRARRYMEDKEKAEKENKTPPPVDIKLEALIPVLKGTLPVKAHAHRADDILTALRIAREFGLHMSIEHCSEGQMIPEALRAAQGVVIGPLGGFPHKLEVKNQTPKLAKVLYDYGIPFAIMSDLPASHTDGILTAAGLCIREGLPDMAALRAITVDAARILGIEGRVGSLAPGKDADIAVFTHNPVRDMAAKCVMTLSDGRIIHDIRQ